MAGLEKKVVYRYSGNGKFAVRKREKQQEAIERKEAYQKLISTPEGIRSYIKSKEDAFGVKIGSKQLGKLEAKLMHMEYQKSKKK